MFSKSLPDIAFIQLGLNVTAKQLYGKPMRNAEVYFRTVTITDIHRLEFILQIDFWQTWNRRDRLAALCLEIHRGFSFAKCISRVSRLPENREKPERTKCQGWSHLHERFLCLNSSSRARLAVSALEPSIIATSGPCHRERETISGILDRLSASWIMLLRRVAFAGTKAALAARPDVEITVR